MNANLLRIVASTATIAALAFVFSTRDNPVHAESADLNQIDFRLGETKLLPGDNITIDEVRGTGPSVGAGNLYEIKGHYTLASHPRAMIAAFTTSGRDTRQDIPNMKTETAMVDQGDGRFTLWMYQWYAGKPHVSFYPAEGGSSFASVYFGTSQQTGQ